MDRLIIGTVFQHLSLDTHAHMHTRWERQGEIAGDRDGQPIASTVVVSWMPIIWSRVLAVCTPYAIRTQEQYPDDYRVAGVA